MEILEEEVVPVVEAPHLDFRFNTIENKWSGLKKNSNLTIFILINNSLIKVKDNILGLDRQVEFR